MGQKLQGFVTSKLVSFWVFNRNNYNLKGAK